MSWIKIGILVLLICVGILFWIRQNKRKKKFRIMNETAYEILKEEALNYALSKNYRENDNYRIDKKRMISLEVVELKKEYIFNLEKGIRIGRDKHNELCIKDETISKFHCKIQLLDGEVWIVDLGSSNHTIIKRKGTRCILNQGERQKLNTKDKIILGELQFKVILFYINKKYLREK